VKIIVGHTNTDLDCVGSMVLARYLFPDHRCVRSHLVRPIARNAFDLFEKQLAFLAAEDLRRQRVDHMVVVDTRSRASIREFVDFAEDCPAEVLVFDHHCGDSVDIPAAAVHERPCGANTTLLGLDVMNRDLPLSTDDATVALLGIYAETGRFTHAGVTSEDLQVAAFLLGRGASLPVLDHLLKSLRDEQQVDLFHRMVDGLEHRDINGRLVHLCTLEMEDQVPGLAAVVERVFEIEQSEALFAVFGFRKGQRSLIVARATDDAVQLNRLLEPFGGGGNARAASATVKGRCGAAVSQILARYLERTLAPAATAADLMSEPVHAIRKDWDLLGASIFLEQVNHTGAPVIDAAGDLVGFLTLRDIMKGRRAGAMRAPVTAYMARPVHTCGPAAAVAQIERLMREKGVGHLPVVSGERLLGIVTRADLLRFLQGGRARNREVHAELSRHTLEPG
jgi:tRNA nucleotidyltransferase (CCA-adding enzyme)